ncbi:DUF6027 family protein [Streptomyces lomondensis]|uniref:Uncharacterized protein n=1 Tax=Streptomyces lomondensis TaxID=68229 RepID=A0ABQ2XFB6_9ACTN|nr:DUF6027 family protein [Streptomyces lomondensis]MCF0077618.1 DUF6027 family protein [Streptomyces lomondensis]GGX13867.1 hypothetical protein GCM10010383_49900 [Streptomyces lomondensis]
MGEEPGLDDIWISADGDDVVRLRKWNGTWEKDDPHANFKSDVVGYGLLDPLETVRGMSRNLDIPVGAIARYVLARWATGGSGGLLEIGPVMIHRLWAPVEEAERVGTDEQRLRAYDQLRQMLSWLKLPLDQPDIYPPQAEDRA